MNGGRYRDNGDHALSLHQSGFTLVELMVAMVVGLFLVGGVASMYFSTLQSYFVLEDNAQVAQRERLAATFVGVVVQSAGYYNQSSLSPAGAFPVHGDFSKLSQFLAGSDDTYVDSQNETRQLDTMQLRMRLNKKGNVLNCLGRNYKPDPDLAPTDDSVVFVNKIFLNAEKKQLECTLIYDENTADTEPAKSPTGTLLSGVVALEFTYGVDTDGDGSADQYLDAGDIETKNKWRDVRSIVMEIGFATHNAATGNVNTTGEPERFRAVFPVRPGMQ